MAITVDWTNKIVNTTSDILDLPVFKDTLRDLEDDAIGMLYPPIITYKRIDLGGGAYFHAVDFINGYRLKFPISGDYIINGNLNADIIRDPGVYVERKTSAAFSTTSNGSSVGTLTKEAIREEIDNNSYKLDEIYAMQGLDKMRPMTITQSAKTAGDIDLELAGNGESLTIVTRQ